MNAIRFKKELLSVTEMSDVILFHVILQLVQFLDRTGIQEEGILRVPGSIARIKVRAVKPFLYRHFFGMSLSF